MKTQIKFRTKWNRSKWLSNSWFQFRLDSVVFLLLLFVFFFCSIKRSLEGSAFPSNVWCQKFSGWDANKWLTGVLAKCSRRNEITAMNKTSLCQIFCPRWRSFCLPICVLLIFITQKKGNCSSQKPNYITVDFNQHWQIADCFYVVFIDQLLFGWYVSIQ